MKKDRYVFKINRCIRNRHFHIKDINKKERRKNMIYYSEVIKYKSTRNQREEIHYWEKIHSYYCRNRNLFGQAINYQNM